MSVLSAQSIRHLCSPDEKERLNYSRLEFGPVYPLISPFVPEKVVVNGKSYGLSACTYDCRIAESIVIGPTKAALVSTKEYFSLPATICGSVLDKSSYARVFVSAFNTHLDPGWSGYLTVELVNLGYEHIRFTQGDPVCQIKFEWLDYPTEIPYQGKYQNQEAGPQEARYEKR